MRRLGAFYLGRHYDLVKEAARRDLLPYESQDRTTSRRGRAMAPASSVYGGVGHGNGLGLGKPLELTPREPSPQPFSPSGAK